MTRPLSEKTRRGIYGRPPRVVAFPNLEWDEYLHYMYLPVVLPECAWGSIRLPPRLEFLRRVIEFVCERERAFYNGARVYVTARRGYATPGNPLNRPGWHADGFGTDDVNYVWTDRFPTLFAIQDFQKISTDHVRSIEQFEEQVDPVRVVTFPDRALLRLDPFVVHAAPEIPAPGGERGFLKISLSHEKYNLRGNSHNYLFDYAWKMWSRDEVRNDPAYAGGDAGPQEIAA